MADPVEDPKPAAEEVEIGGIKYIVTPELAKSLKDEQVKKDKELEALRNKPEPKPEPKKKEEPAKIGDRLFENPDAVLDELGRKIKDETIKEVTTLYEKEKAAEQAKKSLNAFYEGFFKENKELSKDRELVELIFEKNYNVWNQEVKGDLNELKKKLAKKATDTIIGHIKPKETPESKNIFESGGTLVGEPVPEPNKEEKPASLTAVIKAKNAARRGNA